MLRIARLRANHECTTRKSPRRRRDIALSLDSLESRTLLSVTAALSEVARPAISTVTPLTNQATATGSSNPIGNSPTAVRSIYAINQVAFSNGTIAGNGAGQTIAIVDAYNLPSIATDLRSFDAQYGLADPPSFTQVNQTGGTTLPNSETAGGLGLTDNWGVETALDVEWAHSIAPGASILLVEANSDSLNDLITAANYAGTASGVVAVSMSWGASEFSGERGDDFNFTTPGLHPNVTYLAASGDYGAYVPGGSTIGVSYPAASPNVVAVGGTRINLNQDGSYNSESGWGNGANSGTQGGSGGGASQYEPQPSYQAGKVPQNSVSRSVPDVAMLADPVEQVSIYDAYDFNSTGSPTPTPWYAVGGTSLSTPMWAGVVALVDQGRAVTGKPALDGPRQLLPALYSLPSSDFHDATTGNNGYNAATGYDQVTGLGSPVSPSLINDLVGPVTATGFNGTLNGGDSIYSPNGTYRLTMQTDGNLVEYGVGGQVMWASNTSGNSGAYAWLQPNGNLVILKGYGSSATGLWQSGTNNNPGDYLTLGNNGDTKIVANQTANFLWTGNTVDLSGRTLYVGENIYAPNGLSFLTMQSDGNLVEYGVNYYGSPSPVYSPAPRGTYPAAPAAPQVLFASNTSGHPGAVAWLQPQGNLVVLIGQTAYWQSGTNGDNGTSLRVDNSGVGALFLPNGQPVWNSNYTAYAGRAIGNPLVSEYLTYNLVVTYSGLYLDGPNNTSKQIASSGATSPPLGVYPFVDAVMRPDGNFVFQSSDGSTIYWQTNTAGHPGARLTVTDDGHLVVTDTNGTILFYD